MFEKREWARRHADDVRRAVLLEPRGHGDLCGAVLTEPVSPGAHAGMLFMDAAGYGPISAAGIVAATTIALERGLLMPAGDASAVTYDTTAGVVRAQASVTSASEIEQTPSVLGETAGGSDGPGRRVAAVSFVNVPSFVLHAGTTVPVGGRHVRADVAYGGAFFAIVDSEAAGLPLDAAHVPELRRAGAAIARAVEAAVSVTHPTTPALAGIDGTVFTGPANEGGADLLGVTVLRDGQMERSPCGTAMGAIMAVLDAMGLVADEKPFVQESLIGTKLEGRIGARTVVGDCPAIVPTIEGTAWITGEHLLIVDERDPLAEGFRLG